MKLKVFTSFDTYTEIYSENVLLFPDEYLGLSTIRRNVREEFLKGNISRDWCKEHKFVLIGEFDTKEGIFENCTGTERMIYNAIYMIDDLVEGNNNES